MRRSIWSLKANRSTRPCPETVDDDSVFRIEIVGLLAQMEAVPAASCGRVCSIGLQQLRVHCSRRDVLGSHDQVVA